MARELARIIGVKACEVGPDEAELGQAVERLRVPTTIFGPKRTYRSCPNKERSIAAASMVLLIILESRQRCSCGRNKRSAKVGMELKRTRNCFSCKPLGGAEFWKA